MRHRWLTTKEKQRNDDLQSEGQWLLPAGRGVLEKGHTGGGGRVLLGAGGLLYPNLSGVCTDVRSIKIKLYVYDPYTRLHFLWAGANSYM